MKLKAVYIAIALLALAHLVLVIPAIQHPERFRVADSDQYIDLANNLLKTGAYESRLNPGIDLVRPPGYPVFLAIGILLFSDVKWVSLLQILLTLVNCLILYRIAVDLKCKNAGLIAILIYLLNPNVAFESLMLMSETLTSFWLILALWALLRYWRTQKGWWLVLTGASFGFGAITRPIVFPLFIVWVLLVALLFGWQQKKSLFSVQNLKHLLVFLSVGLLIILLWQARNYNLYHQFTLSTVGEITLKDYIIGKSVADVNHISLDDAKNLIASYPDQNAFILKFIRDHPVSFLTTQARGILLTVLSIHHTTWAYEMTGASIASTGIVANLSFDVSKIFDQIKAGNAWILAGIGALVFDIALYGLVIFASWRMLSSKPRSAVFKMGVIMLVTIAYMILTPLAQGSGRFRIPVEPYLALTAGLACFFPERDDP